MALTAGVERAAVLAGAWRGALVVVPVAVLAAVLAGDADDGEAPATAPLLFFLLLAGFVFAGYVAGSQSAARARPVQHGTYAAALVFVAVQAVGAVSVTVRGESISPVQLVANLLLAAACGSVGGLVSTRARVRAGEEDEA